jgi:hypothetical protein
MGDYENSQTYASISKSEHDSDLCLGKWFKVQMKRATAGELYNLDIRTGTWYWAPRLVEFRRLFDAPERESLPHTHYIHLPGTAVSRSGYATITVIYGHPYLRFKTNTEWLLNNEIGNDTNRARLDGGMQLKMLREQPGDQHHFSGVNVLDWAQWNVVSVEDVALTQPYLELRVYISGLLKLAALSLIIRLKSFWITFLSKMLAISQQEYFWQLGPWAMPTIKPGILSPPQP